MREEKCSDSPLCCWVVSSSTHKVMEKLRRCCPCIFFPTALKWWKLQVKPRGKQSYKLSQHLLWSLGVAMWGKKVSRGHLIEIGCVTVQRSDLSFSEYCTALLFMVIVPESKSYPYIDIAFFFFFFNLTPVQHAQPHHAPIRICTPYTHTCCLCSCTHSSSWWVHPNTKVAKFRETHCHIYLNCKLPLCVHYVIAQGHTVIPMWLILQH